MKKLSLIMLVAVLAVGLIFTSADVMAGSHEAEHDYGEYTDGRYRGSFYDGGEFNVAVQFYLEDNVISDPSFRYLYYDGVDYLGAAYLQSVRELRDQHVEALEYLDGKDVSAIDDLRHPGEIVTETEETIDGFSGATIRSSKIMSAMRDALNRGKYDWSNTN